MLRSIGLVLLLLIGCSSHLRAADINRYAVLVGIQKYDDAALEPLEFAERDARDLAAVLEAAGYSATLLTETAGREDRAFEPTKVNIEKALKATVEKSKSGDVILVAFAGHGLRFDGKPEAYLCPRDAKAVPDSSDTLISLSSLGESLSSTAASKVLLIDACRNGPKSKLANGIEGNKAQLPKDLAAIFSCSEGQRSLEDRNLKHGVFFNELLQGLKGKAGDGSDEITFASLAKYLSKEVPKRAADVDEDAKQTPFVRIPEAKEPSPRLALHPQAIPPEEWKEYVEVFSSSSTEPFLKKHAPKRLEVWRRSAEAGSARGMMLLADCCEFGVGVKKEPKESARWYGESANRGNSFAMVGYGLCYQKGFGVKKDDKEAASWFSKSAELGDAGGMMFLGSCYATGRGVKRDPKEAARWYRASAELGFGQAMFSLAMCHLNGNGVEKDEVEAATWFRKGAERGNLTSMIYLGLCYREGVGVAESDKKAFEWFRKAADAKDARAMNLVASCYLEGTGTEKNEKEGADWFRKSAELENPIGMLGLGKCYASGTGVTKSRMEALRWLRKAAALGSDEAKELVKTLID